MTSYIMAGLVGLCHMSVWIFAGIMTSALLLIPKAMSARSLRPFSGGFALCRPWEQRVYLGLMGLMCLIVPLMIADSNLQPHHHAQPGFWHGWVIFTGICLAGVLLFWWTSGPRELAVDGERRTYRRSEGWPPFRRVSAGPLSDLAGVWAEAAARPGGYLVYVGWRAGPRRLLVEQFRSGDGANLYADELADVLGVPRLKVDRFSKPIR